MSRRARARTARAVGPEAHPVPFGQSPARVGERQLPRRSRNTLPQAMRVARLAARPDLRPGWPATRPAACRSSTSSTVQFVMRALGVVTYHEKAGLAALRPADSAASRRAAAPSEGRHAACRQPPAEDVVEFQRARTTHAALRATESHEKSTELKRSSPCSPSWPRRSTSTWRCWTSSGGSRREPPCPGLRSNRSGCGGQCETAGRSCDSRTCRSTGRDFRLVFRQTADVLRRFDALDPADYLALQAVTRDGNALEPLVVGWFNAAAAPDGPQAARTDDDGAGSARRRWTRCWPSRCGRFSSGAPTWSSSAPTSRLEPPATARCAAASPSSPCSRSARRPPPHLRAVHSALAVRRRGLPVLPERRPRACCRRSAAPTASTGSTPATCATAT